MKNSISNPRRRKLLKYAAVASFVALEETATLMKSGLAFGTEPNRNHFEYRNLEAVLSGVSKGFGEIIPSRDIAIRAPDIAETWTSVPVEVTSNIADTSRITFVCKRLDYPLIAEFNLFDGAQHFISTRLRLWDKTNWPSEKVTILVLVHANGKVYSASKDVLLTYSCDGC